MSGLQWCSGPAWNLSSTQVKPQQFTGSASCLLYDLWLLLSTLTTRWENNTEHCFPSDSTLVINGVTWGSPGLLWVGRDNHKTVSLHHRQRVRVKEFTQRNPPRTVSVLLSPTETTSKQTEKLVIIWGSYALETLLVSSWRCCFCCFYPVDFRSQPSSASLDKD